MASPGWALGYLGLLAVLVTGQLLVCGGENPDTSGNLFTSIMALITGTYCDDLWPQVQFLLFVVITIPGVILLFGFIEPLFSGTIGGLIAGTAALLLLGGFLLGIG